MRLMFLDHLASAYRSLHASRTRSILTMLGVLIGVASITTILSLAGGMTHVIDDQIAALGGNLAVVRPGIQSTNLTTFSNPVSQTAYGTSTLTEADIATIKAVPGVEAVAPIMIENATLAASENNRDNTTIIATTPELETVSGLKTRDGQFIDAKTDANTAVVGQQLAVDLYGTEKPIGRTFSVRGTTFTIIGILARQSDPVNYNNIDFDTAAIIHLESGKAINRGVAQIQQINLRAANATQLADITTKIEAGLKANHQGETDFTVSYGQAVGAPTSDLFKAVVIIMTAIAAISLVVGGVGIMNILLVSVAERTREIGIRKAVGATNGSIAIQFLMESLMLSFTGGFLGYLAGYVVAFGISTMLYFAPSVNLQTALAALVMSLGVGLLSGIYPAFRAAGKHPIESLRQYH